MNPIYFTVTGTNYYYGNEYFKPEMKLQLNKEPDNKADKEAIRVELEGLGKVGYVATSCKKAVSCETTKRILSSRCCCFKSAAMRSMFLRSMPLVGSSK